MYLDRLLDIVKTAVNVSGDAVVSVVVEKSEKKLKEKVCNDPNTGLANEEDFSIKENLHKD